MTHIANCIRKSFEKLDSASSMDRASCTSSTIVGSDIVGATDRPGSRNGRQSPAKYQLWPRSSPKQTTTVSPHPATFGTFLITDKEKDSALKAGRSSTSLSENSGKAEMEKAPCFWKKGESALARRRKVSVPELQTKAQVCSSSSEDDAPMDSPTIPGRPPLRKMPSMDVMHSRSSSAPNHWRTSTLDDSLAVRITSPPKTKKSLPTLRGTWLSSQSNHDQLLPSTTYNPTRPLSPILSPPLSAVPSLAKEMPATPLTAIPLDVPPQVPPKNSPIDATPLPRTPPKHITLPKASPLSMLRTTPSKNSLRSAHSPSPTGLASAFNSPTPKPKGRLSPNKELPQLILHDNISKESVIDLSNYSTSTPVIERGRPIRRQNKGLPSPTEEELEELPTGYKPMEATLILPESEREMLRRQAISQTEKFEVLGFRHVENLSKELRALDERCEYLRKTYKSLRAGRQKLHTRMLAYLRSESIAFSREQLLKQESALVELDLSIDEWFRKLERAENRRLRIRQKLLEHVAAAMTLTPAYPAPPTRAAPSTPPAELEIQVQGPTPVRTPRQEVESIKVYADNQVLNLFTDIEHAVSKLCEAC